MTVDIHQLPIPDWGLVCPRCKYALLGLPSHRCPECGLDLNMEEIVQTWTRLRPPRLTGQERPLPDFGLHCRTCDAALAGATDDGCPACGGAFEMADWRPTQDWFVIDADLRGDMPPATVVPLLAEAQVPYVRRVQGEGTLREIYLGPRMTPESVAAPREFYFEVRALLCEARAAMAAARTARAWTCPACGKRVPGNFDVCWSCETPRHAETL